MENKLTFRYAVRKDIPLILQFIRDLAEYEKLLDEVVADEATLEEWIFDQKKAEVIFAMEKGKEVGFALFFHNFSTFLGRAGLYLEDLFVLLWAERDCIWKTSLFCRNIAVRAMGSRFYRSWRPSLCSASAAGWSGGAWTGISPASTSIYP